MICFSNAKINIGLYVTEKRVDGFHNIETLFFPLPLYDVIEFIPNNKSTFNNSGIPINCPFTENLIYKAYNLLKNKYSLPPLSIYINKIIPFGAGLGGGSSNATSFVLAIIKYFNIDITDIDLSKLLEKLGSDCPFFIKNKPCLGFSKGEVLKPIELNLSQYYFAIIKPDVLIPTKLAYQNVKPDRPKITLEKAIQSPIKEWRNLIFNDFENFAIEEYPIIGEIKQMMYDYGAVFSLMTGSGSAVYGLFKTRPFFSKEIIEKYFVWIEQK